MKIINAFDDYEIHASFSLNSEPSQPQNPTPIATPSISSSNYDAATRKLLVTGENFIAIPGANNDIDTSKLSLGPWTKLKNLSSSGFAELIDDKHFVVTISEADAQVLATVMDLDGRMNAGMINYRLAAYEGWNGKGSSPADYQSDLSVSGLPVTLKDVNYSGETGWLRIASNNLYRFGSVDMSQIKLDHFSFIGQNGLSYSLMGNIKEGYVSSDRSLNIRVSEIDQASLNGILNKAGTTAVDGSIYSFNAKPGWYLNGNTQATITTSVNNTALLAPTISSVEYNASTHTLKVWGQNLVKISGANNDVVVSRLSVTGEGGVSHTLSTSANVDVMDTRQFSIVLSDSDARALDAILNKNGTSSNGGTTYNFLAADDWNSVVTGGNIADLTSPITVRNVVKINSSIESVNYTASTGLLTVHGRGINAGDKIDTNKLSFTGEAGASYQLNSTTVLADANSFSVVLNEHDKINLNGILDKNGTLAANGASFNLAAAANWNSSSSAPADGANSVLVSGVVAPTITSATYDAVSHKLVVTGENFVKVPGVNNDINIDKLFLGPIGTPIKLGSSGGVEITDSQHFELVLSDAAAASLRTVIDKNHSKSSAGIAYTLEANDDWNGLVTGGNIFDYRSVIEVTGIKEDIESVQYNASTGQLTVTGNIFKSGTLINTNKLSIQGEGGANYQLSSANVFATDYGFVVTLNDSDKLNVNGILDKNGAIAVDGRQFNLSTAENWLGTSTSAAQKINAISVSGVQAPSITSATYDVNSHKLVVTGENFVKIPGANNDINLDKLFLGPWNATKKLANSGGVEITDGQHFELVLSDAAAALVRTVIDKNHSSASNGAAYTLEADDDWNGVITGGNTFDYRAVIEVSGIPEAQSFFF